jgi:hypothetical protein
MELYSGLDLHSRNTYIGILDTDFKRVFKKRVSNNFDLIVETLEPFKDQLKGLVSDHHMPTKADAPPQFL